MSESETPISKAPAAAGANPAGDVRRRHRGRRGGRGRRPAGSSPAAARPAAGPETPSPAEEPGGPAAAGERPAPTRPAPAPLLERVQRLTERAAAEPAHKGSAISQAIDEVMQIVEALKRAVDQMEDVLELVELAERQKLADEREIDSLRRAMRQLHQRPRGSQSRHGESEPPREAPEA